VFGEQPAPALQPTDTRRAGRTERTQAAQLSAARFRAVAQSSLRPAGVPTMNALPLPKTATDAELRIWFGLLLIAASLSLVLVGRRRGRVIRA
jgi:LPXTG-motif cell wall-anchored protein